MLDTFFISETIQLLVDFGLMVLIWIVQVLIYPSFIYYEKKDLSRWHVIYTKGMTIIVAPLMILQIGVASFNILFHGNFETLKIVHALLIVLTWLMTLLIFVPIHERIDLDEDNSAELDQLVAYNRLRALLWSAVFVLQAICFFSIDWTV